MRFGIDKQIDKMGIKKTGEDLHGIHSGVGQDLTRVKFKFNLYYGVLCLTSSAGHLLEYAMRPLPGDPKYAHSFWYFLSLSKYETCEGYWY